MTKKEVLRKVLVVFSWLFIFYMTVKFLLGKADSFTSVFMFICWSICALNLILSLVPKIVCMFICWYTWALKLILSIIDYKSYKSLVKGIKYLQAVHKARYKLYFTGDKEKIEKYSTEIERYGRAMLDVGEPVISRNLLSKKHSNTVKEILDQTKEMMPN